MAATLAFVLVAIFGLVPMALFFTYRRSKNPEEYEFAERIEPVQGTGIHKVL